MYDFWLHYGIFQNALPLELNNAKPKLPQLNWAMVIPYSEWQEKKYPIVIQIKTESVQSKSNNGKTLTANPS